MLPLPFILLLLVVCAGVVHVFSVGLRLRRLRSKSLSDLIEGIRYVDMLNICQLARGVSNPLLGEPSQVINSLGGPEGLRHLHHNATTMLNIARYLILVNSEPCDLALVVRRDAVKVRRLATILRWQARVGFLRAGKGALPQILASSYVLISVNTLRLGLQVLAEMPSMMQEFSQIRSHVALRNPVANNAS